jgi:hypothetical protein
MSTCKKTHVNMQHLFLMVDKLPQGKPVDCLLMHLMCWAVERRETGRYWHEVG